MRRLLILTLVFAVILPSFMILPFANAQDESEVKVFVVGPDALGMTEQAIYTVTLVGGPAEEPGGKWRVAAHLTGKNVTEASPNLGNRYNETNESNIFQVKVIAPPIPQTMYLNVEGASLLGANSSLTTDEFKIVVVAPISLRATVSNPSNSTLKNVLVSFKVDGELIGSAEPIAEIGPLGEGTATFSWITKDISPGKHRLEIEIDLNGDGVIDETRGETLYIEDFYGPSGEPNIIVVVLIVLMVIVIILLLPSTLRRKRKRK